MMVKMATKITSVYYLSITKQQLGNNISSMFDIFRIVHTFLPGESREIPGFQLPENSGENYLIQGISR